ncbi:conserved hypothetical protein, YceG family [Owenweeksia hongkongensis DSM 17368]|uniref:Endolytic murein transglycosylase n=1 Tax=Owenweeksia hongkongensis (strain DSM 17368 / CIP 108786 / JCM 12287 / NRRL B-23963 / UST20020801) TaxID=926562 RepID=G8R3Y7_OWEHD|nr:endolytic transglycosylase MltG [Owenweeksia hongkongensis]AEV32019.1 conserved hypothetical protein, YceG family [Owenweeksia hongkongensis DSM 17368]
MKKKILLIVVVAVLVACSILGSLYYKRILAVNVKLKPGQTFELFIPTGSDFTAVRDSLVSNDILKNTNTFEWVADKKNYPSLVKPGRYVLVPGMTNNALVNKLRSGDQDAVQLTLHNISGIYELSARLSQTLEGDSLSFLNLLESDESLSAFGVSSNTVSAYFLPNTYELWWNTSPSALLKRMRQEFDKFWNEERQAKAKKLGLTPIEVVTLASIVEKETNRNDEKPTVAGLYANRIKQGMKLQSDPTVIYALLLENPKMKITRVYYKHLRYDSPYNTYMYPGLPPGPIKIPELSTVDAVLNREKHDYIFMVADPERPGYHTFARTLAQHERNRRKYIDWANRNKI